MLDGNPAMQYQFSLSRYRRRYLLLYKDNTPIVAELLFSLSLISQLLIKIL